MTPGISGYIRPSWNPGIYHPVLIEAPNVIRVIPAGGMPSRSVKQSSEPPQSTSLRYRSPFGSSARAGLFRAPLLMWLYKRAYTAAAPSLVSWDLLRDQFGLEDSNRRRIKPITKENGYVAQDHVARLQCAGAEQRDQVLAAECTISSAELRAG